MLPTFWQRPILILVFHLWTQLLPHVLWSLELVLVLHMFCYIQIALIDFASNTASHRQNDCLLE